MGSWSNFTGKITSGLFGDKNLNSSSTASNDVTPWAKGYYTDILNRQSALSKQAWQPYTGQRFTGLLSSNPLFSGAAKMYGDAMKNPLDNPMYAAMSGRMASDFAKGTAANTDAAAARAGAFGSSGWSAQQADNARAYGDSLAQLQGQMYQQGLNAAGQAVNLAQMDQADQQQRLDFDYQQFLEKQGWDQQQINNFTNVLQSLLGNRGTQQQTSTQPNPSRTGGMIGDIGNAGKAFSSFGSSGGSGGGGGSGGAQSLMALFGG
ncbi:MAG TPA: hypothetical protein VFM34_05155 [Moraxellaceae bacterium]|nr:hypothetical protein [Moraxellaceae bacterium]